MKAGLVLLRVTAAVLGLQLLLGGLLTFGFISSGAHVLVGFILLILAVATTAAWFVTKPSFRPMKAVTSVIVVLMLLQVILGESTLNSGDHVVAFLHFVNALAIFGATVSGSFLAMRWERIMQAAASEQRPGAGAPGAS